MLRYPTTLLLAALIFAAPDVKAELAGYGTLTSEYLYRGLAKTDGNAAVQLGVDYQHDSGWFAGAWASTIDVRTRLGGRDWELDIYGGYHVSDDSPWSYTLTVMRYTYPDAGGEHSYDYNEILATVSWNDLVSAEIAYTDDLFGMRTSSRHWQLTAAWPAARALELSATAGWTDYKRFGPSSYRHVDVGASFLFSRFSLDLRHYDSERPDEGLVGALAAGSRLVLSLTVSF